MDKVTDYKMVAADSADKLEQRVNRNIKEGWEPYHGPLLVATASGPNLLQAMVKIKKAGSGGPIS